MVTMALRYRFSGAEGSNMMLEMTPENSMWPKSKMAANSEQESSCFGSLTYNSWILMAIMVIQCRFSGPGERL